MEDSSLVMVDANAKGILGEYEHDFSIGSHDEFVILYGPNGVGKTKFLEIIHALSRLLAFRLEKLPFDSACLTYSDGSQLSVERRTDEEEPSEVSITFTLARPGNDDLVWDYIDDDVVEFVRKHSPYEQLTEELWQDPSNGEILHFDEIRALYAPRIRTLKSGQNTVPAELKAFVSRVPSFLIETQRLQTDERKRRDEPQWFARSRERRQARSRISEQAQQISSLLNDAQTEHSRITQRLDRTFPNRVLLAARQERALDASAIRERYDVQNDFRSRLGRVASVSLDEELSLPPDGELESWALALLDLYLEDAHTKLEPFNELLDKIELLEQIINGRLLKKDLAVTDKEGLAVVHSETGRRIHLESLSSGEQHEIILMIDLLFHVPKGAVVLIDEPEISLHVAWQLAFIPDVRKIAELVGFRFIVATHSPQIINDDWDRAKRLGPKEVPFE
ncbi:AAA family ATPase [Flaviflexus equikiangi]|uniref:AAA family ATPase n=1 Tax=Flaviflexus equikiangi TaxID=2758573 RepID=UPI001C70F97C|nr:AAA family ATPase [Flaviflexus equikiangi]